MAIALGVQQWWHCGRFCKTTSELDNNKKCTVATAKSISTRTATQGWKIATMILVAMLQQLMPHSKQWHQVEFIRQPTSGNVTQEPQHSDVSGVAAEQHMHDMVT